MWTNSRYGANNPDLRHKRRREDNAGEDGTRQRGFEKREANGKELWFDGRTALIGRYGAANCGGVDADKYTGDGLVAMVRKVIQQYRPQNVMLEDFRFGCLYSFKKRMLAAARENGYEYVAFTLVASEKSITERVIERSGNPERNFDAMFQKQKSCIRAARRIRSDGAKALIIDTDKVPRDEVTNMLFEVMNE